MASIEECEDAVASLVERLDSYDANARKANIPDRTLVLHLYDLDLDFRGDLTEGALKNVRITHDRSRPDVKLSMTSDDLVAMTRGELKFAQAWATGRVRLEASIKDLLRLRKLV